MGEWLPEPGPIINSPANDKVKLVRALQRRRVRHKERQFIVEGVRVFEDAIEAGYVPAFVFLGPKWEENERVAMLASRVLTMTAEVYPVGHSLMKTLSDTVAPQSILAVFSFVDLSPLRQDWRLILDGIQDPGNFGTLLRSAEAAGIDQVILAPGTVDVYNPKVVRAGAGAHFRLPVADLGWPEIAHLVKGRPVRLAEMESVLTYYDVDWCRPVALIVSNEGSGPSDEARALATERIRIPMKGGTESLNAAVAGSVILFEAARQRDVLTSKR